MRPPKLSPPVKRPDVIAPHRAVDVVNGRGRDLVAMRMRLAHGANYNDPAPWSYPSYNQMKSL